MKKSACLMAFCLVLLASCVISEVKSQELGGTPLNKPLTPTPYLWRNVEINGGGFISGIIFHPKEPGLIYARTDIGGAYRWDGQTRHWKPITDIFRPDDWNLFGIESIALDPSDANRVYLAVGTYTTDWAGNGAILRSNDRGNTWQRTNLPFKNGGNEDGRGMGERLIVHPRDPKTLFFGSRRNGLWTSHDFGVTWVKVSSFPAPENENGLGISFLTLDAHGTLFAGVASKTANLFQSTDDGVSWQAVTGAPQGFFPHHGVFASDGTFYLSYSNGPGPNGVSDGAVWKRSADGTWTEISPVKLDANNGFGFAGLAVDAQNPRTLMVATLDRWAQGDDIFRSTDGGVSWKSVRDHSQRDTSAAPYLRWGKPEEANIGHWFASVAIDPFAPGHVLYGTGATMWGSDDANALDKNGLTHWDVRAAGIEEVSVSKLISPPVGPHLISGMRDIGGFVHDDLTIAPRGGMMTNPLLSRNESLDYATQQPNIIVRTGSGKGGYSLDSGQTWTPFASLPPENMDQGPIAVSAEGKSFVWSANYGKIQTGGTYYSRDRGTTWAPSTGLPAKTEVAADGETSGVFYCLDKTSKTLLISTDGGATFTPRFKAIPDGIARLEVTPNHPGHLWLLGDAGLWRSTDGGVSFSKVAALNGEALGFGKAAPGANYDALYLTGKVDNARGVFRSDDEGKHWIRLNDDGHQWGWIGKSVTGDPRVYGRVYIATNGRGIIWGEPAAAK